MDYHFVKVNCWNDLEKKEARRFLRESGISDFSKIVLYKQHETHMSPGTGLMLSLPNYNNQIDTSLRSCDGLFDIKIQGKATYFIDGNPVDTSKFSNIKDAYLPLSSPWSVDTLVAHNDVIVTWKRFRFFNCVTTSKVASKVSMNHEYKYVNPSYEM